MNNDLISRSALLKQMKRIMFDTPLVYQIDAKSACETIEALVDVAPAVDAVEVVRCKDCKHSAIDNYTKCRMCILNGEVRPNGHIWFGTVVNDDRFCSYGENMDAEAKP